MMQALRQMKARLDSAVQEAAAVYERLSTALAERDAARAQLATASASAAALAEAQRLAERRGEDQQQQQYVIEAKRIAEQRAAQDRERQAETVRAEQHRTAMAALEARFFTQQQEMDGAWMAKQAAWQARLAQLEVRSDA